MTKEECSKKKLPDTPGVYFFIGARKEILYIGKATSLRNRVRSYFSLDIEEKRSELIKNMVIEAKTIECTPTDSTLEALILETNLIRSHKPRFNTKSKDDKSYNHLIITNEEWPRVLVVRGKDITEKYQPSQILYNFGPFPNGQLFREALKIVRRLFKFYDTTIPVGEEKSKMSKGKVDFNRQIGLYPNSTSRDEYMRTIRHIKLFFEAKKSKIIAELKKDMMAYAKNEQFELANIQKKKIFTLEHIQDIALISDDSRIYKDERTMRIESYDVAHLMGKSMVGVMTVVEGESTAPSEYRKFKINSVQSSNDVGALKEILERRLSNIDWPLPQLIVVDGSTAQKNVAEQVLKKHNLVIPVVAVVKDERHKPIRLIAPDSIIKKFKDAILLANSESHRFAISYHRNTARKRLLK